MGIRPDVESSQQEPREEAQSAQQPALVARMLALQRTVGNAAVAAHMLGSATNALARQPTADETTEPPAGADVVPDAINPDDRAWRNAVERLKTITRIIMQALGRDDIETIRGISPNLMTTRYQLKDAALALPETDIRRARYEEQADHLYNAAYRLFDLANPSHNALSLWIDVGNAAAVLHGPVNEDTQVDFKDQLYREAVWEVNKVHRELNMIVHDRPIDKAKLTVQHQGLSLAIARLDTAVATLPADDPRKLARHEANESLSSAQYRIVQLLSEIVAANDIWDMLRISCDHIDPGADPLPPNPYDVIMGALPPEAFQAAEESAPG